MIVRLEFIMAQMLDCNKRTDLSGLNGWWYRTPPPVDPIFGLLFHTKDLYLKLNLKDMHNLVGCLLLSQRLRNG